MTDVAGRRTAKTRARDSDRNDTCRILDGALAEGQLTMEEHRQRLAVATRATTLAELEGLTTDLQTETDVPVPRRSARRGWLLAAGAGGAVAIVVAVVIALTGDSDSTPPQPHPVPAKPVPESPIVPIVPKDPGSSPDGVEPSVVAMPTEFHTLDGMTALLDTIRQRFGDTTGIELAIWRDQAMLFRADPGDDQVKLLYRFSNGWTDPSSRPRDSEDVPADLGAFDVKTVVEALRVAPETVGIPPDDVSDVVIDIDQVQDPAGAGALELMVKVSSTSGDSGFVYLDSAGAIKSVERAG